MNRLSSKWLGTTYLKSWIRTLNCYADFFLTFPVWCCEQIPVLKCFSMDFVNGRVPWRTAWIDTFKGTFTLGTHIPLVQNITFGLHGKRFCSAQIHDFRFMQIAGEEILFGYNSVLDMLSDYNVSVCFAVYFHISEMSQRFTTPYFHYYKS